MVERSSSRGQAMIRNSASMSRTRTWVLTRRSARVARTCGSNSRREHHIFVISGKSRLWRRSS